MKRPFVPILLLSIVVLATACQPQGFQPDQNLVVVGMVSPEDNQPVVLEDGAAIRIPVSALEGEVQVQIERNPDKTLPDFSGDALALGNFYEFTIVEGEVEGQLEITLPFDPDLIPEGEGALMVAFPTVDGWDYQPGIREGDTVRITTDRYADPIIAWHFKSSKDPVAYCSFNTSYTYDDKDNVYHFIGTMYKTKSNRSGLNTRNTIQKNRPLVINLVPSMRYNATLSYSTKTDDQGNFDYQISGSDLEYSWYDIILVGSCPEAGHTEVMNSDYMTLKHTIHRPTSTPDDNSPAEECSSGNCKTLHLENYSGTTDTITLIGPETYVFPFGYGVSSHSLVYGDYWFEYTSCDGKWTSSSDLVADSGWSIAGPPNCGE